MAMAEPAANFALSLALGDTSDGLLEHQFTLPPDGSRAVRIGRSPKNDLTIEHPGISWFHVELRILQGPQAQLGIKDLSANGTGVRNRGASEFRMIAKGVETALADDSTIVLPMKMKVNSQGELVDTRKHLSVNLTRGTGQESSATKGEVQQTQEQDKERGHSSERFEKKQKKRKSEVKENGTKQEPKKHRKATQEKTNARDRRKDRPESGSVERADRKRRAEALAEGPQELPTMEVRPASPRASVSSEKDRELENQDCAVPVKGAPPGTFPDADEGAPRAAEEACSDGTAKATLHEVIVEPGRIGLRIDLSGQITDVAKDGKGQLAGVKQGWVFRSIEGLPYSQKLLKEKVAGEQSYRVTFSEKDTMRSQRDSRELPQAEEKRSTKEASKERHSAKSKHRRHKQKSRSRSRSKGPEIGRASSPVHHYEQQAVSEKENRAGPAYDGSELGKTGAASARGKCIGTGDERTGAGGGAAAAGFGERKPSESAEMPRSELREALPSNRAPSAQRRPLSESQSAPGPEREKTLSEAPGAFEKAREEAGAHGGLLWRPEAVHPVVGTRLLTPILESGADIGGARSSQQANTATGKPFSASAMPSQFASVNDIAASKSLLKGALPQPSTAQSLPPWIVAGAKAQWWSDSLKRLCPVVVSKVDETKRQVIVTFSEDTKVWKSVPFSMLNSKSCPLLSSPQAAQASLTNPEETTKASTAVQQRPAGRKGRGRSRSRTPEWWETEKKRLFDPMVSEKEIEERAAKEREDKARKDEQRRKELLEVERRKVEEAFEKRKKEAEERKLREEEAWRQKLRAERESEAAMEEQKREERRLRREEEKRNQAQVNPPPPPPPPLGGAAQQLMPSAGQAVIPALGIPVVTGLPMVPGMGMGGHPQSVVPGLVGMPVLPGMPGHLFPGGLQHGF